MSERYLFILILLAKEEDRDSYLLQLKTRAEDSRNQELKNEKESCSLANTQIQRYFSVPSQSPFSFHLSQSPLSIWHHIPCLRGHQSDFLSFKPSKNRFSPTLLFMKGAHSTCEGLKKKSANKPMEPVQNKKNRTKDSTSQIFCIQIQKRHRNTKMMEML